MSLVQYLKDKRYFLLMHGLLTAFLTAFLLLSADLADVGDTRGDGGHAGFGAGNAVYAFLSCVVFAAVYLAGGYLANRTRHRALVDLLQPDRRETVQSLPAPRTAEQALYSQLLGKLQQEHARERLQLLREMRDHQDYVLSWIHEVKLPIAAGRLILENGADKSADYLTDKLEDELDKIDSCVEQALYYSRIDSFSKDYFISETPVDGIVRTSLKKFAKLFITKRIQLSLFDDGEPQHAPSDRHPPSYGVQSDSKWLLYIVDQALGNALKYTPDGGSIAVRFEEDAREKRLLIEDTGIGIREEDVGRVFEKGFTGENGRIHRKSTGLGLYLAKQLALKLGHELSLRSRAGQGTTFVVHFPKLRSYLDV
ncbi:sensor histidine kinase [Paenibacillus koleovorans]|uniref:sensor histidine kinase n=1 Tax=Paenibacillus koleovorans TaxID=121608 RepID=UPI000FD7F79A|nr:sensor histidine kinase [Paenibacillus koleovorans]